MYTNWIDFRFIIMCGGISYLPLPMNGISWWASFTETNLWSVVMGASSWYDFQFSASSPSSGVRCIRSSLERWLSLVLWVRVNIILSGEVILQLLTSPSVVLRPRRAWIPFALSDNSVYWVFSKIEVAEQDIWFAWVLILPHCFKGFPEFSISRGSVGGIHCEDL